MENEEFLTASELAAWLKVKLPTVRRWQLEGLPCFRVGRLVRYEPARVRLWLEQRAQKRNQQAA
jgi:excisionase family DNA binding protein